MTCGNATLGSCNVTLPGPSLAQMCGASAFVVFMSLIDELARSNEKISGKCERVMPIENPEEKYDFVVVGGGGAGAVIAGRLSENPDWNTLVIEAGPDEPAGVEIPILMLTLLFTEVDWNFTVTNEKHACLSSNTTCQLFTAKMLGGCTSHNGMIYNRGVPKDYDKWAADGNEGWTWNEVKKFYLKGEDNGEIERVGRTYHSTGGPLPIERYRYLPEFAKCVLAASKEAGYGVSDDLNGAKITGFSVTQTSTKNGVRFSSSRAYLWPVRERKNLHVSLNSYATRVIIEKNKAVGVEYYQNGKMKTVRASREVVISTGTVMSPHLLLHSGIGPKKHLESVGIKVAKDLPGVGENFHDHFTYVLPYTINEPDVYETDNDTAAEYFAHQTGPLSGNGLNSVIGNFKTKKASPDYPDVQLAFAGYGGGCGPGPAGTLRSTGNRVILLRAVNLRPHSRGRITLASNNPFEYPVVWGNYLSNSSDVDTLVEAIELGLGLADTEALRARNFTLINTPNEACSNYKFRSKKYWACAVRYDAAPENHMAGSCKMGPISDPMAVVDNRLRVHGIKGLRVADVSIMPQITSGNTAAPAMMIGERAADFIKKDWSL